MTSKYPEWGMEDIATSFHVGKEQMFLKAFCNWLEHTYGINFGPLNVNICINEFIREVYGRLVELNEQKAPKDEN